MFAGGRIHFGDHLIELGSEAFERGSTALLEFLILLGGEDNEFAAVVPGDGKRTAGGEAGDLAELVFEDAGGDLRQVGDGGKTKGVRSWSGVGHGLNVRVLAIMARLAFGVSCFHYGNNSVGDGSDWSHFEPTTGFQGRNQNKDVAGPGRRHRVRGAGMR